MPTKEEDYECLLKASLTLEELVRGCIRPTAQRFIDVRTDDQIGVSRTLRCTIVVLLEEEDEIDVEALQSLNKHIVVRGRLVERRIVSASVTNAPSSLEAECLLTIKDDDDKKGLSRLLAGWCPQSLWVALAGSVLTAALTMVLNAPEGSFVNPAWTR